MKITEKQISGAVILVLILAMIALVAYWANNRTSRVGPEYETTGAGNGCDGTSFVTTETEVDCDSERVLTGTVNQVIVTDNGVNSTVVLSLPQSINTTADVTFDDVIATGLFGIGSVSEFLRVAAPATIRLGGRDNIILELDTNNNSASDFCLRANGVATDIFCIDESGNVTLAIIDGDLNTFVDIKPDSFDSVDAGADEECLTYEGTNTVEWQACNEILGILNYDSSSEECEDSGDGFAGALTLLPTTSLILLTISDSDACNITMSETGMTTGDTVTIVNISSNVASFLETAGVQQVPFTGISLLLHDTLTLTYVTDQWIASSSVNN
jgi:hypothetical protein